ncbi:MAG TPA: hypothetical protein VMM14_09395 [Acidimicrobiia bacterium]|nr:hypothetical protein [Acidimicrobiia bacterium]
MPGIIDLHPDERGRAALSRVGEFVAGLGGLLGQQADRLLTRHGYQMRPDADGPHRNVLGHPLFELPIWLAAADGEYRLDDDALVDICESSLCGYLSVRAEDDYFDGDSDDAGAAMILSGVFRARHHALLAPLVSERRFWTRFERIWRGYGEAMLLERSLHHPAARYGKDEFDQVLQRSQPLEIPGDAVLAMRGLWDRTDSFSIMVRHVNTATQLFDDFVDAPADLELGNLTWMVRRLGGVSGSRALRRGMIVGWDEVVAEVRAELDAATRIGETLGLEPMSRWVTARQQLIDRASERMYRVLFGAETSDDSAGVAR